MDMEKEKDTILKKMFLIISLLVMAPVLLYFIRGFAFGSWQYLPLAIFAFIGCIVAVLLSYYFFRKKFFPKVG